jgi:hypothetical protein
MFQTSTAVPVPERTVGVVSRRDELLAAGCTLLFAGKDTFLIDAEGRVVHEWPSARLTFCGYLLENGDLLRDGSESADAPLFKAGGAAGYVERVTWDNELVWRHCAGPYTRFLTHHDLEPLPNGNVLVLAWERVRKGEAEAAGRHPDLLPDGEVWDQHVIELQPDGAGGAAVAWRWRLWDHLVQDHDEGLANYGDVAASPQLFDLNFCPVGGKAAQRNQTVLSTGEASAHSGAPRTGEKDWVHCNALSYCAARDQIILSLNVPSELIVIDHATTAEEAAGHTGGRRGKGGDILYRFGNPATLRAGSPTASGGRELFCQHSCLFIRGAAPHISGGGGGGGGGGGDGNGASMPGEGHVLVFNNGRQPDRHWSTCDEWALPERGGVGSGDYERASGGAKLVWRHGSQAGHAGSFYCTHISGCQRLPNGNTLITMGPQGTLVEVTAAGEEVWRYVSPVVIYEGGGAVAFVRQGDHRPAGGRVSLFRAQRYGEDHPALAGRTLTPGRYLEA